MNKAMLVLVAFSACGMAYADEPVLSATSYGKVGFGDRLEDVEMHLNEKAPAITDSDENLCRQVEFKSYPGVHFMIEAGRVTRAASSKPVETSMGYTVGASMVDIKKAFPTATVEHHPYVPHGHYVTVMSKDAKTALLMEEAEGKIIAVRGGLLPSVQYIEGCL